MQIILSTMLVLSSFQTCAMKMCIAELQSWQWHAGYYLSGRGGEGAVGCQPICAPILSRLIKEGRRHEPSAVGLSRGGPGACPPGTFLNLVYLKCHFLDFGGRFDRNLTVRKWHYNVSKFAICTQIMQF